jgi:hypothetical protein
VDQDGRDPDVLYRGSRLGAADAWAKEHSNAIELREQEFLDANRKQAEEEAKQASALPGKTPAKDI